MAVVTIRDLRKSFGPVEVLHGVSVDIAEAEFVVLVGPSGCGKSTLLRMLAGLEHVTSGEIHIGDRLVNDLPPKERDIAMVFQNYALYPHLTVAENMAFSLTLKGAPKAEIQARVRLAFIVFKVGIFDSRLALILTYPTFLIPFCTWLLMGYFRSIPFELEESALVDGATRWQILTRVILPLAVPGLISAGIFAFTLSWNEFIYALTFISSSENKTVPVGVLTELVRGDIYEWGALMSGALVGSLPVVILYSFFVDYYVSSMTGAVKE